MKYRYLALVKSLGYSLFRLLKGFKTYKYCIACIISNCLIITPGHSQNDTLYQKFISLPMDSMITVYEKIIYADSINYNIPQFDSLFKIMQHYPDLKIEIGCHTDCRASKEYNFEITVKRANKYKQYLVKKGIDSYRIHAVGYGDQYPVLNCNCMNNNGNGLDCSESEFLLNKRTTIRILHK